MHFGTGKSRDVLCRACWTARRDKLVTTSATRTTRVQGRRYSVDWGGHVHLTFPVVPKIDSNPEHKKLNLYTRALSLLHHPAMLEQARRDKRDTSCVSCRDEQVEFGLNQFAVSQLTDGSAHKFEGFPRRRQIHGWP